jgi:hypothetical protein
MLLAVAVAGASGQVPRDAAGLPASSAREILERYDIGQSQLARFADGQPLSDHEEEVLIKILYRVSRLGLDNLARWRRDDAGWEQVTSAPADFRAEVLPVRGRVKSVDRRELSAEQAELFEFSHYFQVSVDLDDSPEEAVVMARQVPAAWSSGGFVNEPARADALFLKQDRGMDGGKRYILAAGRIAWMPQWPNAVHGIGPSHVALAQLGMDAGLWEIVRAANRRGLGDTDREAFYQLLAAVGHAEAGRLRQISSQPIDIVELLERPSPRQGEIFSIEGTARRIMKVMVSDRDIQSRFGLDHYYEIDLFLPLGATSLSLGKDPTGETGPVYRNNYPATLIVRSLPPGLKDGEAVHHQIRAAGVFFKVWTYRSAYTSKFGQLQPAPLFVAREALVVQPQRPVNQLVSVLAGAIIFLVAGVLVVGTWWSWRATRTRARISASRSGQVEPPPDFSHLA